MSSILAPAVPDLAARADAVRKVFGERANRVEALRGTSSCPQSTGNLDSTSSTALLGFLRAP